MVKAYIYLSVLSVKNVKMFEACNLRIKYTFPKFIFRNQMLQNEAILRKSISDERNEEKR